MIAKTPIASQLISTESFSRYSSKIRSFLGMVFVCSTNKNTEGQVQVKDQIKIRMQELQIKHSALARLCGTSDQTIRH